MLRTQDHVERLVLVLHCKYYEFKNYTLLSFLGITMDDETRTMDSNIITQGHQPICFPSCRKDTIQYLQDIIDNHLMGSETPVKLQNVIAIIRNELKNFNTQNMVLNMAVEVYYQLINKNHLEEELVKGILQGKHENRSINQSKYVLLLSILSANCVLNYDITKLTRTCATDLKQALDSNDPVLPFILKCFNILTKQYSLRQKITLECEEICFCLQYNQNGMKDELLLFLLDNCNDRRTAFYYFQCAVNSLLWTKKEKYYILGCTLKYHNLSDFLDEMQYSDKEFFKGLQISLTCRHLLVPSQYFVKQISEHKDVLFERYIADILINGSVKEIDNFYNFWLPMIKNVRAIFDILKEFRLFEETSNTTIDMYHLIVIFNVFSKEIYTEFKPFFTRISILALNECFQFSLETQYFIYRLSIDNMHRLPLTHCLNYIYSIFEHHKSCDNTEIRAKFINRIPVILDQIIKLFTRSNKSDNDLYKNDVKNSILKFFSRIQTFIVENMNSPIYQNSILALKLLHFLMRSQIVSNNNVDHTNRSVDLLRRLLNDEDIFKPEHISRNLLKNLRNSKDFDDTRSIAIDLLKDITLSISASELIDLIYKYCIHADINECYLSVVLSKVFMNNYCNKSGNLLMSMYNSTLRSLKLALEFFKEDTLLACKSQGGHLFGYINVLTNLVRNEHILESFLLNDTIKIIKGITNYVLSLFCPLSAEIYCASFEEMDIGLEILVESSSFNVNSHSKARKFLLLSLWYTLKACCELSSAISEIIIKRNDYDFLHERELYCIRQCIEINVETLTKCRHRGATETAGFCIGRICKYITFKLHYLSEGYQLLAKCVKDLYNIEKLCISTTRRGAGYPMLFLHIIKNESSRYDRPILKSTLNELLQILHTTKVENSENIHQNYDRLEVLTLHFLCVLIRDTEIKEYLKHIYSDLIITTAPFLNGSDWSLCNGTLQLFGALVPKIVGQPHLSMQSSMISTWISVETSYDEIIRKYPGVCEHVLDLFSSGSSTSSPAVILFLDFFQRIDYVNSTNKATANFIVRYRRLLWSLMNHVCAKVRRLAAICFIRVHEFRNELPQILLQLTEILFQIRNENFMEGVIFALYWGIIKIRTECQYIIKSSTLHSFERIIRNNLLSNFNITRPRKAYTTFKLLELLQLLNANMENIVQQQHATTQHTFGYDLLQKHISCKISATAHL